MLRRVAPLWRATFVRYLGASVISLGADLAAFLALQAGGMLPGIAAALGYSAGILMHWLISSRAVFDAASDAGERRRQQVLFVVSALAGLSLTFAIVSVAAALGVDPRLAKLVAIAVSFQATYLLRARIVFA